MPVRDNIIYLTFDDGPHPGITPWVLETLKPYNAKATFFLIGKNAEENPQLAARLTSEGHAIGNHTYNHLRSSQYSDEEYITNVNKAAQHIQSDLFRPPYGILWPRKAKKIARMGYKIVMWDIITGDFDQGLSADRCIEKTLHYARPGSVIVFHDSKKAEPNLKKTLPVILQKLSEKGYRFEAL